jgi:hypothetical protein
LKFLKRALAMTVAGLLTAQPCAAASYAAGWGERKISAFAGINVRMPLGQARAARPSARLQLTTGYSIRDVRTGSVRRLKAQGLEIGAGGDGAATFHMNGQSKAELQKKLGLSGSTSNTVWIILGVTLVAVGVLVLSNSAELPGPPI